MDLWEDDSLTSSELFTAVILVAAIYFIVKIINSNAENKAKKQELQKEILVNRKNEQVKKEREKKQQKINEEQIVRELSKPKNGIYKKGKKHGNFKYWYRGKLYVESTFREGKADGVSKSWYENGQIKEDQTIRNGKQDGFCRGWYSNGQLKYERTYIDSKLDGVLRNWNEDGVLRTKFIFENNIKTVYVQDGRKIN